MGSPAKKVTIEIPEALGKKIRELSSDTSIDRTAARLLEEGVEVELKIRKLVPAKKKKK